MNRSRKNTGKFAALTSLILLALLAPSWSLASAAGPLAKKAVLVAVDNISWAELREADDPTFNRLLSESAIGLLNVRVHKNPTRAKEYITVGASARSNAPDDALALDAGEPFEGGTAGQAYERRTGRRASANGSVALSIPEVDLKNKKLYYNIIPGSLGQALAEAGKKAAVIGNADISTHYRDKNFRREVVYLAMTEDGKVELGDTGKDLLVSDPSAPYGVRLDPKALMKRFGEYYRKADFIVIDFGDTVRADMYDGYATPEASARMKKLAIEHAGRLIAEIKKKLSPDDVLIVASLSPPGTGVPIYRGYEEQLTPILVSGQGFTGGYLTSESTHQRGLVTNLDIAPTVLWALGLEAPANMFGREFSYLPDTGSRQEKVDRLIGFNARAIGVNAARTGTIVSFSVIIGLALIGTVSALLLRERYNLRSLNWFLRVATLTIISFPLSSFMFAYYLGTAPSFALTLSIVIGAVALAALAQAIGKDGLKPAGILAAMTLIFLTADILTGGRFNVDTIFGYDTIVGGRFYGMGNEGYSVALGGAIILFATLAGIKKLAWRNLSIITLGIAVALLVGFPELGSNLGGVPTVVTAVLVFVIAGHKGKLKPSTIALGAAVIFLAVIAFIGADLFRGATTHVGRTAKLISTGGPSELWLLLKRRVTENLDVFQASAWSYVLLVIVPIAAFLRYRPVGLLDRILKEHPNVAVGFSAALVSGLVGYLVEDSGIIIPAIILAQFLPVLVYVMLAEGWRAEDA
ncbi:MAG: hypothetical protein M1548_09920 [Actinobacteria bacterium]|nr:hypothetical protein [Actinomycetota bacterium]